MLGNVIGKAQEVLCSPCRRICNGRNRSSTDAQPTIEREKLKEVRKWS